ncbi:MAG: isopeptide-forming domain-containing fimbrial protein, partial [Gammaproteobacteria bacterium]|nr:isopeptide-forming domain-containing fimbrial protein [Gammaproteobacteria bacterium]
VEAINKQNPVGVTTVGIGDPFTYTLNIPVLYDPATGTFLDDFGSSNDLHSITITDDLNATGANLTVEGTPTVTWLSGPNAGLPVPHTYSNVGGLLTFEIDPASNPGIIIPAGDQLQIAITVVADNTNAIGTQFVNTARWTFGRLIYIDLDGDGIPEPNFFDPLPGENGVTDPLTIGGPELVLTKTNPDTAINAASTTTFTLDIQNTGSTNAWNAEILDLFPDSGIGVTGMCDFDPTATVTAEIFEADGVTTVLGPLVQGLDYSVSYNDATAAPACQLSLSMLSPNAVIGPAERLIITYDSQLDIIGTVPADDGTTFSNYAGVTQWYSGDPTGGYPVITYTMPDPVTGTPGTIDYEDSHTLTAALTGYIFQKTVENVESGTNPATSAFPGDTLRYRLRLFNFTEVIDGLIITDTLDPALFDLSSFAMVTPLPDGVADYLFNGTTGELQIIGDGGDLDLDPGVNPELIIDFEIDIDAGLANGTSVPNQALAETTGLPSISTLSDDPYVNGVFDPLEPVGPGNLVDQTVVTVQGPGALLKENPVQTSYTIGEQFTYTITVPAVAVGVPLYDVRILDDLSAYGADLGFVSATVASGHSWTLSNTGTTNDIVIEDTGSGIDIPANEQAIIEVTVQVENTLTNQQGVSFNNRAFYTYNRTNGNTASQTDGVTDPATDTTANMTLVEPNITIITKTADNTTPTAGEIVRYSVDLTADTGANISDVFDVQLIDTLDLGLVYAGNPTVTAAGGVSADNTIGAPDVTGDGINTAQTLEWNVGNADIDIVVGDTITIEYDVQVLDSVLANQNLNNNVVAQWSSVDGSVSGERTGIDGIGGLNDYETPAAIETLVIADIAATILKEHTDDTDTFVTGDDDVRIGDIVEYTITLTIPEGTLGNLQLVDTLPQGLDFEGVASINGISAVPYTAVAPFSHADIAAASIVEAGDPTAGPTTVTWNLGDVNNQPIDDTANDFVIVYRARVMDSVLAQANSTPLNNTVTMSYDTATTTVNQSDIDTTITVLQPDLSVTKSATAAGGDIYLVANELVTYTVDITNNGFAPAYDVVLEDTIPVGLRNGVATVTIFSSDLVSVAGYAPMAPTYDNVTGVATWDFDTGVADAYTMPPGETLRVEYTVQVDAVVADGLA